MSSGKIGEDVWIVYSLEVWDMMRSSLAKYASWELDSLKGKTADEMKAINKAKKVFPGSEVVDG